METKTDPRRHPRPRIVGGIVLALLIGSPADVQADPSPQHELEEVDVALARTPTNVTLLLERSVLLVELRRFDAAMATIARAESIAPGDARIGVFRASAEMARGRADVARAALDAHLRRFPDDRAALLLHAAASEALDDVDSALDDLQAALVLRYDDELALRTGRLLRSRGRRDDAARLLIGAARREPAHPAILLEAIASLRGRRDYDGALALVERLGRGAAVPTRMELLRGEILREAGRRTDSIRAFRRAAELANGALGRRVSAAALVERARARMGLSDFENARIDLEAARSLAPGMAEIGALLDAVSLGRYAP